MQMCLGFAGVRPARMLVQRRIKRAIPVAGCELVHLEYFASGELATRQEGLKEAPKRNLLRGKFKRSSPFAAISRFRVLRPAPPEILVFNLNLLNDSS